MKRIEDSLRLEPPLCANMSAVRVVDAPPLYPMDSEVLDFEPFAVGN